MRHPQPVRRWRGGGNCKEERCKHWSWLFHQWTQLDLASYQQSSPISFEIHPHLSFGLAHCLDHIFHVCFGVEKPTLDNCSYPSEQRTPKTKILYPNLLLFDDDVPLPIWDVFPHVFPSIMHVPQPSTFEYDLLGDVDELLILRLVNWWYRVAQWGEYENWL